MRWLEALTHLGTVAERVPLAPRTTLGVGGYARWLFRPASQAALAKALPLVPPEIPVRVLGRGSNLLVADGEIAALVVDMGGLHGIQVQGTTLIAEAGARMGRVASIAAAHGLGGLEFMATIPGTIGGGAVMNAGAFGHEFFDRLQELVWITRTGARVRRDAREIPHGYRHAAIPADAIVVEARFALSRDDAQAIRARMRAMRDKRQRTQPLERPNCGSVFKNPPGDFAARLIEAAGLKGLRIGGAMISERHANFIVNLGHATAADVRALIARAQEEVKRRFGVQLEPEVRIWEEAS